MITIIRFIMMIKIMIMAIILIIMMVGNKFLTYGNSSGMMIVIYAMLWWDNDNLCYTMMGWWLSMLCYDGMMIIYAMIGWW